MNGLTGSGFELFKKMTLSPGWCSSVDLMQVYKPNGYWFNSQSGHMPGLRTRSPIGGMLEATTH